MDETALLIAVFGAAGLLALAHRQGLRLNVGLAKATARDLEEALRPADATYTWIGGAIGFHATYELEGGRSVRATATFLPRHSPLYLPVARLVSGHDKLQITVDLGRREGGDAHLLDPAYLRWRFGDRRSLEGLAETEISGGGRRLLALSADEAGGRWLADLAAALAAEPGLLDRVRHVALSGGDEATLYCLVVPRPGLSARAARIILAAARELRPRPRGAAPGPASQGTS